MLSKNINILTPFQSIEPFEDAYPNAFSAIGVRGVLSRLLSGVGQRRTFDCHISRLKEPFYLTGDKSARLALIEPLSWFFSFVPIRSSLAWGNKKKEEPHQRGKSCSSSMIANQSRLL